MHGHVLASVDSGFSLNGKANQKVATSALGLHKENNKEKHQQENEKEKIFKQYLNNDFIIV